MSKRMPGFFAHALSALLALLLTVSLLLTALTLTMTRVLTDQGLHEGIATDALVTNAQMDAITAKVTALAEAQSFQPETVTALIAPEELRAYNRDVTRWWMDLLTFPEADTAAPVWDTQAIQEAVLEDPLFQEAHTPATRRTIARDQVAFAVGREIQSAVLPLRTQLIALAADAVRDRLDVSAHLDVFTQLPLWLGGVSAVLALMILLLTHRRLCKGGLYIGSALAAAGLILLLVLVLTAAADVPGMLGELSALLALQVNLLLQALAIPTAGMAAAGLLLGFGLIGQHQRRMSRLAAHSEAA